MITLLWVRTMVAEVNVKLSHSTTSLEQPVRLKLQIEGENDASPDLSVLKQDFEILGRSSSQNISIINGKMSKNQGLTLTLLPKKTGKLTIPPIPVGEESSTPLTLDVVEIMQNSEAADSTSAFILLELNKSQAYLQEEIILTVRVYQAEGIRGEALTEPVTSLPDTVMRLLHEEQYQAEHEGQSYQVIERLYTIYAYQTGKLELGEVRYRGRSGSRPSIFNLMRNPFSDPIQESKIIHATSEQLTLEILPAPSDYTGKRWLPARNLQIVERDIHSNGPILAGNPASRQIMVFADGLTSSQLPVIEMALPQGLKHYPERPQVRDSLSREGVSGSRQTGVTLVATEPGSYILPAIEIPWWNTETNQQELARLPAVNLEILPNLGSISQSTQAPYPQATEYETIPEPQSKDKPGAALQENEDSSFPTWLVWLLGAGWLATLLGWWISHRREQPSEPIAPTETIALEPQDELPEIADALESAYQMADQEAARAAWLRWGKYHWPGNPPSNLNRLAKRCSHNTALAVTSLDRSIYSPENPNDWDVFNPRELLETSVEPRSERTRRESLVPLNP